MCGRYYIAENMGTLKAIFDLPEEPSFELPLRYNIAPTQEAPFVRQGAHGRELAMLRWGLIPSWAKDASIAHKLINARAETIAEKPSFRHALAKRRGIVPASGFFEWKQERGRKQPYLIRRGDGSPLAFAGLWERWAGNDEHGGVETFTIITTAADERMQPVHKRMPVILSPVQFEEWLDPSNEHPFGVLASPATDGIELVPVSSWVNNVRHDDARCIEPITSAS